MWSYSNEFFPLSPTDPSITPREPTVKVLQPSKKKECLIPKDKAQKKQKQNKTLLCVATDFYPDHVSVFWQIDGDNVTSGVATSDAVQNGSYYSITSRLTVPLRAWLTRGKIFNCTVSYLNGTTNPTIVHRSDYIQSDGDGMLQLKEPKHLLYDVELQ